jgi:hypothetical protein
LGARLGVYHRVKHVKGSSLKGRLLDLTYKHKTRLERLTSDCLGARLGDYLRVKHVKGSSLKGRLLALLTNIRLGWKGLLVTVREQG